MFFQLLNNNTAVDANAGWYQWVSIGFMVVILGLVYFFMYRSNKKREQKAAQIRNNIEIGDHITTIGGMVGVVVSIKDSDEIVFETSGDKTRIKIKRWAIQSKDTISD